MTASPEASTGAARLLDGLENDSAPPRRNGELVFESVWESRAFGLAIALREAGVYEWEDFRQGLIAHIAAWENAGADSEPWSYYRHWMAALEELLVSKGAISVGDIDASITYIAAQPKGSDH